MRRPAICGEAQELGGPATAAAPTTTSTSNAGSGRLSRVKKLFTGSLLMVRRGSAATPCKPAFGTRLEELPLDHNTGVPRVLARLVGYIETHGPQCGVLFRPCAGNPKLAERLRLQFDRVGDADLEATADPATAAQLLRVWLRELPEPLIPAPAASALLQLHEKLHGESACWREAVAGELRSVPELNLRSLLVVMRLLAGHGSGSCRHLPPTVALAPVLLRGEPGQRPLAGQLLARMAREVADLRLLDHAIQVTVGPPDLHLYTNSVQHQQRKRKERHESFSQERKVIRSNSEERPLEDGSSHRKDISGIRRVCSHEDFSLVRGGTKGKVAHTEFAKGTGHSNCISRPGGLPLHERNITTVLVTPITPNSIVPQNSLQPQVGNEAPSEFELSDDNEHERRRSCERFSRSVAPVGRRNVARRQRKAHRSRRSQQIDDADSSSKENEEKRNSSRSPHPPSSTTLCNSSEDEAASSRSSSAHSFLQLHPQERERSPSPVAFVSPPTPPLDLTTLHQQIGESEPQPSRRGSLVLRHLDPSVPPSPPHEHAGGGRTSTPPDVRMKQLSKQAHSLKKKVKQFEEDFEKKFGYRPSHSDKMTDKEMKRVCAELNKVRKEIKYIKEELHTDSILGADAKMSINDSLLKPRTMEDMVHEVEKHLADKRFHAGRPENVDDLTREQVLDEKVAVQKALLHMEEIFGRPVSKGDRDLVRPLYDRYRALKRLVIRSGASKLKDSAPELATILEHETMEFISSPPSTTEPQENDSSAFIQRKETDVSASSESLWENLHSLPLSELLSQQRTTREDKKRLRRTLREFEDEFQRRTGRKIQKEDRAAVDGIYSAYKQAKAKLRLLEALVAKQT